MFVYIGVAMRFVVYGNVERAINPRVMYPNCKKLLTVTLNAAKET
jgi:hypothetical protein